MNLLHQRTTHRLLVVCLGNICRSPGAHALFWWLLSERREQPPLLMVDSAGTSDAHEGQRADPRLISVLGRRGLQVPTRSRPVHTDDFYEFDTILAMDRHNLEWLKQRCPAGARAELGLMLDWHPDPLQHGRDVPDPYYGNERHFEEVLEMLEPACRNFIAWLLKRPP